MSNLFRKKTISMFNDWSVLKSLMLVFLSTQNELIKWISFRGVMQHECRFSEFHEDTMHMLIPKQLLLDRKSNRFCELPKKARMKNSCRKTQQQRQQTASSKTQEWKLLEIMFLYSCILQVYTTSVPTSFEYSFHIWVVNIVDCS